MDLKDIQIIPIRQIEKPGARVKSNHINIGVSNFLKGLFSFPLAEKIDRDLESSIRNL